MVVTYSHSLTAEQVQILALFSEGVEGKEACQIMHYSDTTMKRKVTSIFHKLGAKNRTHAVGIAYRTGILPVMVW